MHSKCVELVLTVLILSIDCSSADSVWLNNYILQIFYYRNNLLNNGVVHIDSTKIKLFGFFDVTKSLEYTSHLEGFGPVCQYFSECSALSGNLNQWLFILLCRILRMIIYTTQSSSH